MTVGIKLPNSRLLGVDYGRVRIGLAITDRDRILASPLETYVRVDANADAEYFRALVVAEQVGAIVLGLPIHNDGSEGKAASEVRLFGSWLQSVTDLPIEYWDERFTTVEAETALWNAGLTHRKRRDRRDQLAAQILLQDFLEAHPRG